MAETLSERVAALEDALAAAERQASAQRQRAETAERNEAMLRLRVKAAEDSERTARVEGAREALTRLESTMRVNWMCEWNVDAIASFKESHFALPAVPEKHPAPSAHAGEARPQPSVFRADSAFVNSLRVGGLCADCQALNRDASVTWKFCPRHTLNLRADQNAAITSAASVRVQGGRVIVDCAAVLEMERVNVEKLAALRVNASESGDTAQGSRIPLRPTPPAEGEPKCVLTHGCRKIPSCERVCWLADPTPQAVTEPLEVVARSPLGSAFTLTLTTADCQRIVAMASRPTAEDK